MACTGMWIGGRQHGRHGSVKKKKSNNNGFQGIKVSQIFMVLSLPSGSLRVSF